ncbi:MAG: galactose mutarotase [Lachnospiraceae bacterium]|nr:galactose mutarotase [Lachnospiraceae bacterium]
MLNKKPMDREGVFLYTLKNQHMEVDISNFGATLVAIRYPDTKGNKRDIILGYDTVKEYEEGTCFFGALVGRNANRIGNGEITINQTSYLLDQNDGTNNLHSGSNNTAFQVWQVKEQESDETHLYMECLNKEKEHSFPGNVTFQLCYELTEKDELKLKVTGVSDKDTIMNVTNHVYFQLNGATGESMEDHLLELDADTFTPLDGKHSLPTGEVVKVAGTPFDFTTPHTIGERIDTDTLQLNCAKGYDHNYILNGNKDREGLTVIGKAKGTDSGITLLVASNCPCVQFYSGNYIPEHKGKGNVTYKKRSGFCLEPQVIPDAMHLDGFQKPLIKANESYEFCMKWTFGKEN